MLNTNTITNTNTNTTTNEVVTLINLKQVINDLQTLPCKADSLVLASQKKGLKSVIKFVSERNELEKKIDELDAQIHTMQKAQLQGKDIDFVKLNTLTINRTKAYQQQCKVVVDIDNTIDSINNYLIEAQYKLLVKSSSIVYNAFKLGTLYKCIVNMGDSQKWEIGFSKTQKIHFNSLFKYGFNDISLNGFKGNIKVITENLASWYISNLLGKETPADLPKIGLKALKENINVFLHHICPEWNGCITKKNVLFLCNRMFKDNGFSFSFAVPTTKDIEKLGKDKAVEKALSRECNRMVTTIEQLLYILLNFISYEVQYKNNKWTLSICDNGNSTYVPLHFIGSNILADFKKYKAIKDKEKQIMHALKSCEPVDLIGIYPIEYKSIEYPRIKY